MTLMILKKVLTKLKEIILFLLPLSYLPYVLFVSLSSTQTILALLAIGLLIWRIYALLKKVGVIAQKEKTNKLLIWFDEKLYRISAVFHKLWIDFIRVFTYHAKSVTVNLELLKLIKKIQIWQEERHQPTLRLVILFQVLPRIINLTAFLIDIFYFHTFFYFYKTLSLLLLPLIYAVMESIIKIYHEDNLESVRSCLVITSEGNEEFFTLHYKFTEDFACPPHIHGVPDFVLNHYLVFIKIQYMFLYIETLREYFYIDRILLGISVCYLIGWSYILFFGISF